MYPHFSFSVLCVTLCLKIIFVLKHLKHHQIDKKKWDKCISSSKENIIYAFSWYLDCVSSFWEGFVLEEEDKNEYRAVMPLPVKKKNGISFLEQPLFAQQLGVFSAKKLSSLEFESFLTLLQEKFKLISNYPFNVTNYEDFENEFEELIDKNNENTLKEYKTHHLSLQHSYKKLRQNYKRDTKYRINQAQKQNFKILESNNIDLLYDFFEKSVFLENGISKEAKPTLKALYQILKEKEMAKLYYIQNRESETVSGLLFVKSNSFYQRNNRNYSNTKWIYLFNAAKRNVNQRNESRRWFLDKFIKESSRKKKNSDQEIKNNFENQSKGIIYETVLDFESAQETEVARFYESFGSEEKLFFVISYNKLPFFIKISQKIVRLISQFSKGKMQ